MKLCKFLFHNIFNTHSLSDKVMKKWWKFHDIPQLYANCSRAIAIGSLMALTVLMKICCKCCNFCSWILADYCGRHERWMTSTECYLYMLACYVIYCGQGNSLAFIWCANDRRSTYGWSIEWLIHNMYVFVVHHIFQN